MEEKYLDGKTPAHVASNNALIKSLLSQVWETLVAAISEGTCR